MAQQTSPISPKLHDDLHLTADQETAWSQYAAAIGNGAQIQAQHQAAAMMLPQLQTPRRLALIEATMTEELADFRRQSQAINAFYARLTADQQRTFDRDTQSPQHDG